MNRFCDGVTRRDFVRAGALGSLGVASYLRATRAADAKPAKATNAVFVSLGGGPSHIDTFDPKPDAPAEVRGEFKPIATSVPGIQVSDRLPKAAKRMQHAAILRGMSTSDSNHPSARNLMHTVFKKQGGMEYPTLGSLVSAEL